MKFLLPQITFIFAAITQLCVAYQPKLYWYGHSNFGDELSKVIVERIINKPVARATLEEKFPVLFAVGSIIRKVRPGDIIWGSGFRGDPLLDNKNKYANLTIKAVRGPRSRELLIQLGADCPEVYGDPALLLPLLFPELKRQEPVHEYIIIPHLTENSMFQNRENVVYTHEHWSTIIDKILKSKLVISSSLHGIIVAEAFGVPARLLKVTWNEGLLKYQDYYESTGRPEFTYATSVEEALEMGGEKPIHINLEPLLNAFPFEYFLELKPY